MSWEGMNFTEGHMKILMVALGLAQDRLLETDLGHSILFRQISGQYDRINKYFEMKERECTASPVVKKS